MHYRYRETVYHIAVVQARVGDGVKIGETSVTVDGVGQPDMTIRVVDDRQEHSVEVRMHAVAG